MSENVPVILARRRFLVTMSVSAVLLALNACTPGSSPTVPGVPTGVTAPTQPVVPLPPSPQPPMAPPAGVATASAPGSGMATAPMMPMINTAASATRPVTSGSAVSSPAVSGTARPVTTTTTTSAGAGAMSGTAPAASTGASTTVASTTASDQATGQTLVIKAVDYGFQTMGSIPGGLTTIQLQNLGKEPHQAQLGRLKDGVTYDQFLAAVKSDLANNGNTSDEMGTPIGGPNAVVAGSTGEVIQDLKAGQHVLICFIPNAMGMSHAALGMILPLTVTAPTGVAVAPPTVNGTITLKDDNFDLATLPAGRSLYRVVNGGTQPADFQLLGIASGKTLADVTQYVTGLGMSGGAAMMMAGPPPVTGGAGIATLAPGESGIVVFNLVAGEYAAWTGDPSTGIAQFTVA